MFKGHLGIWTWHVREKIDIRVDLEICTKVTVSALIVNDITEDKMLQMAQK